MIQIWLEKGGENCPCALEQEKVETVCVVWVGKRDEGEREGVLAETILIVEVIINS